MRENRKISAQIRPLAAYAITSLVAVSVFASSRSTELRGTSHSDELISVWEQQQARGLDEYLARRGTDGGPNEDFDIYVPKNLKPLRLKSAEEAHRDQATRELADQYYSHQGFNRYLGVFIESGAAHADGYQWNTQRWAGLGVKALRDKFLDQAVANGIVNIRLGLNLHELDPKRPQTLEPILDFHREAWRRGIAVTDSVLFFTGLSQLAQMRDGKIDAEISFQNNPRFPTWAEDMATFALTAIFKEQRRFNEANAKLPLHQQKAPARTAINPVNEPETFAGFNHFWNGGLARWDDPNLMRLYVPTIVNIARANVRIRMATERAAAGERVLYFHNEAMTPPNYPSHQGDLQFAVSQFMLGHDDLMTADFDRLSSESFDQLRARFEAGGKQNAVEASILKYALIPANVTVADQEAARARLISMLKTLRQEHLDYQKQTNGKTAKTDTMLMVDYYQQSEFILPKPVPELITELVANGAARLKEALDVKSDQALNSVLRERVGQAEHVIGHRLWTNDLKTLLTQEDAIVLDKVIGLRNEYTLISEDTEAAARRTRVGFDLKQATGDELRIDGFLSKLVANDGELLKVAFNVKTNDELTAALRAEGVSVEGNLRASLNANERAGLHKIFGLRRARFLGFLPPHYARQMRLGLRKGFAATFLQYEKATGLGVGGQGEGGTPYYPWASLVHKQMMIELVAAAKISQFSFIRSDIGPAVGTIGWMAGPMTGSLATNKRRGDDGIFKLVKKNGQFDYELSAWPGSQPWFSQYRDDLLGGLKEASVTLPGRASSGRPMSVAVRPAVQVSYGPLKMCADLFRAR